MSASLYSWARFAGRTLQAAAGTSAPPYKLLFVVTKRCHSRCVYCDIWKVKDQPGGLAGELTLPEIKRFATQNPFFQWIDFTGGEPTDRPDFAEVVLAFAEANPDLLLVHFPTNGIATKRIVQLVQTLRPQLRARLVVTVSIDGPPELNDRLRGIRNDFSHALSTFVGLRKLLGPENAVIGMTLHGHKASCGLTTADLVEQTFAALNTALVALNEQPIGWESLHLNIPHISEHYYGNTDSRSKDGFGGPQHRAEVAEALSLVAGKTKVGGSFALRGLERIYRREALRYLTTGRTQIACSALQSTAYLSESGEIYPCTIWDKPLGNVRAHDFSLLPILAQARADGTRLAVAEGRCPRCWTPCEAYPAIAASPVRALGTWLGVG